MDRYLIYDLGLHHGYDTEFYLNKGFKVIAVEANPAMIRRARNNPTLAKAEEEGRLGIVPMAFWHRSGESISFYVNSTVDDYSSIEKVWAEKHAHESREIKVATISLDMMFEKLGVPYYVKCDIEGADEIFSAQLPVQGSLPAFVSSEASPRSDLRILEDLRAAGYDRFQIVNQARHHDTVPPNPPREGNHVEIRFNGHMSGLFGLDLPPDRWTSFDKLHKQLSMYGELRQVRFPLTNAWFDIHATKKETLAETGAAASV